MDGFTTCKEADEDVETPRKVMHSFKVVSFYHWSSGMSGAKKQNEDQGTQVILSDTYPRRLHGDLAV
jgi:hypothetical protein